MQQLFKTTELTAAQWVMISGAAILGTFWMEIRKLIEFGKHSSKS